MTAVEEVLATWRDAERLLDDLPPIGRDHETVVTVVASLKVTYARITDESLRSSPLVIAETLQAIASSRDLIAQMRSKAHTLGA
jgi:hypothetical protein